MVVTVGGAVVMAGMTGMAVGAVMGAGGDGDRDLLLCDAVVVAKSMEMLAELAMDLKIPSAFMHWRLMNKRLSVRPLTRRILQLLMVSLVPLGLCRTTSVITYSVHASRVLRSA